MSYLAKGVRARTCQSLDKLPFLNSVHAEVPSELKPLSDSFIHVQKSTDALYAMSEFIENSE